MDELVRELLYVLSGIGAGYGLAAWQRNRYPHLKRPASDIYDALYASLLEHERRD